jgi:hypothetical protein
MKASTAEEHACSPADLQWLRGMKENIGRQVSFKQQLFVLLTMITPEPVAGLGAAEGTGSGFRRR